MEALELESIGGPPKHGFLSSPMPSAERGAMLGARGSEVETMHGLWLRSVAGAACGLLGVVLVGCGGDATPTATMAESGGAKRRYWTVRQAESIAVVRGQPVHVRQCRGLGSADERLGVRRYARFACTAGTGLEWETFDSVSVTYVLVPLGP